MHRFHPWESANGTSEERGQFPVLYVRILTAHQRNDARQEQAPS